MKNSDQKWIDFCVKLYSERGQYFLQQSDEDLDRKGIHLVEVNLGSMQTGHINWDRATKGRIISQDGVHLGKIYKSKGIVVAVGKKPVTKKDKILDPNVTVYVPRRGFKLSYERVVEPRNSGRLIVRATKIQSR
jgi:hypothetical protein